nr:MAG TPA: hypothetical protein [Caudoviricetes sp.]
MPYRIHAPPTRRMTVSQSAGDTAFKSAHSVADPPHPPTDAAHAACRVRALEGFRLR